jgi:hypothetical protein
MIAAIGFTLIAVFVCWLVFCICDARQGDENRWWHNTDHKWW